jgi:predicted alpha/beta-fold hydrolase
MPITRRHAALAIFSASYVPSCVSAQSYPPNSSSSKRLPTTRAYAKAAEWLTLPPTPTLPAATRFGRVSINGVSIFFAQFGSGPPVMLFHGGLGNSNYWGNQIRELSTNFAVTVMDTRGHGRSPVTSSEFSYAKFAEDAVGLISLRFQLPRLSVGATVQLLVCSSQ